MEIKQSISNALQSYQFAENELNRPNEDSVPLCACHSTRVSMTQFLQSYLIGKSVPTESINLSELLNECSKIDKQFSGIDLTYFKCGVSGGAEDNHYCLSVEKVNECFNQVKAVKEMVFSKLNLSERDF